MTFNIATSLAIALVATSSMGVRAAGLVSELNIVEMDCVGEPAGYKKKCVRKDGMIWGCNEGDICVLKSFNMGKCLRPDDPVPTDSPKWAEKGKGITCASRGAEAPMDMEAMKGKKLMDPNEGNSCSAEDMAKGCQCAGARWRCADACDMTAKACDEGFKCMRTTKFAYAICANDEILAQRGITERYDPATMATGIPCGEDIGKYQLDESQWFIPGTPTGKHADRCAKQAAKHADHGHGPDAHSGDASPAADGGEHGGEDHSAEKKMMPPVTEIVEEDDAHEALPEDSGEDHGADHGDHDHGAHGGRKMLGVLDINNRPVTVSYMKDILGEADMWLDEEPDWHKEMVAEMQAAIH